jgi:hypothetical protein
MSSDLINKGNDYVREFLYGPSDILCGKDDIKTSILMDERMEGWIGIPHGGISMGIMMDLAMILDAYPQRTERLFPISAAFRLGGASAKIGNVLNYEVSAVEGGVNGRAFVEGDPLPYMSASLNYRTDNPDQRNHFLSYMPKRADDVLTRLNPLPSYKKCFVCGVERTYPGLRRQFQHWDVPGKIVIATAGFNGIDFETFQRFRRNDLLHPLPFLALLDETLGWGGFLISASGAVTVDIHYTFYRSVSAGEKLLFFGRGERVRGKKTSRLMFWASGGAAAVKDDGSLEMIVSASGQWFGVQELTEQMKMALLPKESTERAFAISQS